MGQTDSLPSSTTAPIKASKTLRGLSVLVPRMKRMEHRIAIPKHHSKFCNYVELSSKPLRGQNSCHQIRPISFHSPSQIQHLRYSFLKIIWYFRDSILCRRRWISDAFCLCWDVSRELLSDNSLQVVLAVVGHYWSMFNKTIKNWLLKSWINCQFQCKRNQFVKSKLLDI